MVGTKSGFCKQRTELKRLIIRVAENEEQLELSWIISHKMVQRLAEKLGSSWNYLLYDPTHLLSAKGDCT